MRRTILLLAALLPLAGCALPRLPSLPSIGQIKEAVAAGSDGDTARDAVAIAAPLAQQWAPDALLVDVRGSTIDTGGRDHGLSGGSWTAEYQSTTKQRKLAVRVVYKQAPTQAESAPDDGATPLDASLGGLLDSPDAITKAGLSAHSYAVILRGDPNGARYDVLGEGAGTAVTLDARTGNKL